MARARIAVAGDEQGSNQVFSIPENRLMLAVLEEALSTFKAGIGSAVPRRRKYAVEVEQWAGSSDSEWPFSFENICSTLGLDAGYIRLGLRRMKRAAQQGAASPRLRVRREHIQDRRTWRAHIAWKRSARLACALDDSAGRNLRAQSGACTIVAVPTPTSPVDR